MAFCMPFHTSNINISNSENCISSRILNCKYMKASRGEIVFCIIKMKCKRITNETFMIFRIASQTHYFSFIFVANHVSLF